ncbi:potassium channel family protein [Vreelandella arcis]|uniref:Ion channel n=1 Tax=Vreelandella arcis TaxID=416873 RepID=A0A1H0BN51_9GAMM|nr:potassium channel family protein [Halomonas arcis]SDN47054.1 Ion channel [Halomonas arcis]
MLSGIVAALLVTVAAVVASVLVHYEVAIRISRKLEYWQLALRGRFLVLFMALFGAHLAEIGLFSVALIGLQALPDTGQISGSEAVSLWDYVYMSAISYTTLGFGDLTPEGGMRLLLSAEGLIGFMLITWSASITFLQMQQHWAVGDE